MLLMRNKREVARMFKEACIIQERMILSPAADEIQGERTETKSWIPSCSQLTSLLSTSS